MERNNLKFFAYITAAVLFSAYVLPLAIKGMCWGFLALIELGNSLGHLF